MADDTTAATFDPAAYACAKARLADAPGSLSAADFQQLSYVSAALVEQARTAKAAAERAAAAKTTAAETKANSILDALEDILNRWGYTPGRIAGLEARLATAEATTRAVSDRLVEFEARQAVRP